MIGDNTKVLYGGGVFNYFIIYLNWGIFVEVVRALISNVVVLLVFRERELEANH